VTDKEERVLKPNDHEDQLQLRKMTKPTPIEAELMEMTRPRHDDYDGLLWWVEAFDPDGELRGIGTNRTLAGAMAQAWISVWDEDDEECWKPIITRRFYQLVPRHIPDGWTFEAYREDAGKLN
jgi:hypothetical protein